MSLQFPRDDEFTETSRDVVEQLDRETEHQMMYADRGGQEVILTANIRAKLHRETRGHAINQTVQIVNKSHTNTASFHQFNILRD